MPGYSWSDPYQDNSNTAASIQSKFKPENISIAPIVAAIMRQRQEAEQMQNQQYQQLGTGIGNAVSGAAKAYTADQNSGQADDAANAAIYGQQYPNDPLGGYTDPNKVPDYGGTDALKTDLIRQKLTGDPWKQQYEQARIAATQALTDKRYSDMGSDGSSPQLTPRQNINTLKDAQSAAGDAFDQYGLSDDALNGKNIHAPSDTPAVYSSHKNASGEMVNDPAVTVPQGYNLVVDPTTKQYQYVTPDQITQARNAQQMYQQAQQQYRNALNVGASTAPAPAGQAPPPGYDATGNNLHVSQNDVNQANQGNIIPGAAPSATPSTPAPQGAGTPPSGSVRVVAPNGQAGTIPAERLPAYISAGYRQL